MGVSFSTLARIERGEGEPDNNSLIRILEWLGDHAAEAGLSFEDVALVHFRASKNVSSKTIHCLIQVAGILKRNHRSSTSMETHAEQTANSVSTDMPTVALSKNEMEDMAQELRRDLGVSPIGPVDSLAIEIEGVDVFTPAQVDGLTEPCVKHLTLSANSEWSAMSVPLDADGDQWAIFRNDKHQLERQRVTYLEECWHILLGHKLTKIAKVAESYGRTFDGTEEHDAYYLASATLLPAQAISTAVRDRKTAQQIGNEFGTSPDLVEYRIKRLGLWRAYKGMSIKLSDDPNTAKS